MGVRTLCFHRSSSFQLVNPRVCVRALVHEEHLDWLLVTLKLLIDFTNTKLLDLIYLLIILFKAAILKLFLIVVYIIFLLASLA